MIEKQIQTLFGRKYRPKSSEAHELKFTKTGRLPFARLAKHQENALLKAENGGLYHKISDMSAERKPFDSFFLVNVPAYVVVCFYEPRKPKTIYFIRIKDFLMLRDQSSMKSMTEEEAKMICEKTITI